MNLSEHPAMLVDGMHIGVADKGEEERPHLIAFFPRLERG